MITDMASGASVGSDEGLTWKIVYDDDGRLSQQVDPAGGVTQYVYTPAAGGGLLSLRKIPPAGAPVAWQFDAEGRTSLMTDDAGEVAYRYDGQGQLAVVARAGAPEIRYGYDAEGRLSAMQIGDQYLLAWTYDYRGRLIKIETPAGPVTYEYITGANTVVRSLPNGIRTFLKRGADGALEQMTHGYFAKPNATAYTVLARFDYTFDAEGRLVAIREHTGGADTQRRFDYDTMNRLIRAAATDGREYNYAYDLVGNRVQATATDRSEQNCTFDWAGRLASVDGQPCAHDACGNLLEATVDGITRRYRYRYDGRLAEVTANGETAQYGYDGSGRLISRTKGGAQARFVPDPLSPIWQPLVMDEPDGTRTLIIWDGPVPLLFVRDGRVEWLLHDHIGSVRLVTDDRGNVIRQHDYDPFGNPERGSGCELVGYAGLINDPLAGVHTAARTYVPALGRFLQPDPRHATDAQSVALDGLYSYARNNPLVMTDRDGCAPSWFDPAVASTTNFASAELLGHARANAAKLITKAGPGIPGPTGVYIGAAALPFGLLKLTSTAIDAVNYVGGYGGDPAGYAKLAKVWLDGLGLWAPTSFWGSVAGAVGPAIGVAETIGSTVRSGVMQQRAQSLAYFGGAVCGPPTFFTEDIGRHSGSFQLVGSDYGTVGGWVLNSSRVGLFGATNHSIAWARSEVLGRRNLQGDLVTGTATRSESRIEQGGHLFNLFEPTSVTVTRRSSEHTTVTHRGGMRMADDGASGSSDSAPTGPISKPRPDRTSTKKPQIEYPAPFGGASGPAGFGADQEFPPGGGGGTRPSPVGGVFLGGAGDAVGDLGQLQGVRLDANNNLVLIAHDGDAIAMPPMRVDDVVTVFRSVYLHGEGPSVTIDPSPADPERADMIIRHGKATEDTYVGWVLYEADRLMKAYTLGRDNRTHLDVASQVPGYAAVMDTVFFGAGDGRRRSKDGGWERFWIVPAAASRVEGPRRELSLFDVPLKVKTQKMKWNRDRLEDDTRGTSSPGATAFTEWFAANYDGIALEQYLVPPVGSGITETVPVFAELRRIALCTAIAEKLRDQGVPLPFWMRDHEVGRVSFERVTPVMEVTRTRSGTGVSHVARAVGGVNLSPESSAVRTYATPADAAAAPAPARAAVEHMVTIAGCLEDAVASAVPTAAEPMAAFSLEAAGRRYRAVSMPGAGTLALNPCRLDEPDVVVPLLGGGSLRLVRRFNSFFDPRGPWGRGWALDLPVLQEIPVPTGREGNTTTYAAAFELTTPLNSVHARFRDVRPVPELGNAKLYVPDQVGPFLGMGSDHPRFLKSIPTRVLLHKDGGEWHFTDSGDLAATRDGRQVTVYERDAAGRLARIVALTDQRLVADIELGYDAQGRLAKAVGRSFEHRQSRPVEVSYSYADGGRLAEVATAEGSVLYGYHGSLVASVSWRAPSPEAASVALRSFEYNARGQMTSEQRGSARWDHDLATDGLGVRTRVTHADGESAEYSVGYDRQMRLLEVVAPDGSQVTWDYTPSGDVEKTETTPGHPVIATTETCGGRRRTVRAEGAPEMSADFDAAGRLLALAEEGRTVIAQKWRHNGQLYGWEAGSRGATFNYGGDDVLSSILVHPRNAETRMSEWEELVLDPQGRPVEIKDCRGLKVNAQYDTSGALVSLVRKTDKGNEGYAIKRDHEGRPLSVNSSRGATSFAYEEQGGLASVESRIDGQHAFVRLAGGQVECVGGFAGGETRFTYLETGPGTGMSGDVIQANGLALSHGYDGDGKLASIAVGDCRQVRFGRDGQGRITEYAVEPTRP